MNAGQKKEKREAEAVEDEQDSDEEFVKKSTIIEYSNELFEFDTATMVHTTNRKDLLANPHLTTIKIKGHDGTKTKTELISSAYIKHKGQKIKLQEIHYHPNFSNLVSGLVWSPPYSLQHDGDSRTFVCL
jgi:hypothetical protein